MVETLFDILLAPLHTAFDWYADVLPIVTDR